MAAKHITIAQTEGPKAGFTAWMDMMERSGLPQVQERLAEVKAQGNKKAQFEYYCNVYGNRIFGNQAARNVQHEDAEDKPEVAGNANESDLFNLFTQFMERVSGNVTPTDEDDSLDEIDDDEIEAQYTRSSGGGTRKAATTKRTARATNAQTDDPFAPRNPEDDATSGRLWRLNELGLLQLRTKPGTHISNGQAHKILKQRLGNS